MRSILKPFSAAGSGVVGAPETDTTACTAPSPLLVTASGCVEFVGAQAAVERPLPRVAVDRRATMALASLASARAASTSQASSCVEV